MVPARNSLVKVSHAVLYNCKSAVTLHYVNLGWTHHYSRAFQASLGLVDSVGMA